MTDARETLRAHLQRTLNEALRDIPGIGDPHVRLLVTNGVAIVTATLRGWSPSLHAVRMALETRLPCGVGADLDENGIDLWRRSIEGMALRQRERAEDAARLGSTKQLTTKLISHLQIDSALPELRGDSHARTRLAVVEAVRRVHATTNDHAGGAVLRASGVMLGERREDGGGWLRIVAPNVKLKFDDGRRMATLRDFELDLEAPHLPDTLLAALEGRLLGDLARIHPAIDGRTIRKAANRTHKARPGLLLRIDLHTDPVDEVLADAARLAA